MVTELLKPQARCGHSSRVTPPAATALALLTVDGPLHPGGIARGVVQGHPASRDGVLVGKHTKGRRQLA